MSATPAPATSATTAAVMPVPGARSVAPAVRSLPAARTEPPSVDPFVDQAGGRQRTGGIAPARPESTRGIERRRGLDRDHRIGAWRELRAGRDPDGGAGVDGDVGRCAGSDVADDLELDGSVLAGGQRVGGPDRVAVHRGVGPGRE